MYFNQIQIQVKTLSEDNRADYGLFTSFQKPK